MFLLSTSPGGRGGMRVLEHSETLWKRQNPNFVSTFSLPSFHENFNVHEGITNEALKEG